MEDEDEIRECKYLCSGVEMLQDGSVRHIMNFCYKRNCECIASEEDCDTYGKKDRGDY